jgi:hypothetical protein
MSKCIYLFNIQGKNRQHFRFFPSQFADAVNLPPMDRLLMAAHDMTDALKYRHSDFPFETIRDDTNTSQAQLAKKIKNKFQKPVAPEISQAQIKAAENKQLSTLLQKVLTSPVKHNYQTRSPKKVIPAGPANVIEFQNGK